MIESRQYPIHNEGKNKTVTHSPNGENGAAQIDAAMARTVTTVGMKERIMKRPVN